MKTLVLRRGISLAVLLFMFVLLHVYYLSDILSDSSRRLPKSQNPNQISDLENVQMDRPDVQAGDKIEETEQFSVLESRLGALYGNMEELSNLNRDDTQG